MNRLNWACFCSQTGNEIMTICKELKILPTVVITNHRKKISEEVVKFLRQSNVIIIEIPFNPTNEDYFLLKDLQFDLYTLNGFLRILPKSYLNYTSGKFYNGHPGLITQFPHLKGKDPQLRAYEEGLLKIGSVIHNVIPEVDAGDVIVEVEIDIQEGSDLNHYYSKLKTTSLAAWKIFFKEHYL